MSDSTSPRRGRPPKDRAAVRRRILDGADAIFRTRGIQNASVADVARSIGLSYGSLYNYFDGRRGLIATYARTRIAVADDHLDLSLEDAVADILRRLVTLPYFGADDDPRDGVDAAIFDVVAIAVLDQLAARIRPLLPAGRAADGASDRQATALLVSLATIGSAYHLIGRGGGLAAVKRVARTIALLGSAADD